MVVAVNNAVPTEPVSALVPDQPPLAEQAVALLEAQLSVEALPFDTVLGLALKLTVTVGLALTVTVAV